MVETRAGAASGRWIATQRAGATSRLGASVFRAAELIVKVEPQPLNTRCAVRQILFTYLHLAADRAQADALMAAGVTAIANETVTAPRAVASLLAPDSEVAGRMAVQVRAEMSSRRKPGGIGKFAGRRSGRGAGESRSSSAVARRVANAALHCARHAGRRPTFSTSR